jgi:hypothetical protein
VSRRLAALLSLGVLGAVLSPIGGGRARDGFPLSSYPMFAQARATPELRAVYAVGFTATGERRGIRPSLVATGEVLQARAAFDRADGRGREGRRALCVAIAARIVATGALPDVVRVELRRGRHDAVRYFATGELGEEQRIARCDVPGRR